jgi:hypothetical protein
MSDQRPEDLGTTALLLAVAAAIVVLVVIAGVVALGAPA